MRWRRGALFLIKFLSKLAILGTLSIEGQSTSYPVPASLRPLFAAPTAPYFHLRRGLLFSCTRGARLAPNRRRGDPCTDCYCHYHLPAVVHKMDTGILAQQSDVRCKRGRLCVILMAPVAYLPHRGASEQLIEPTAFAAGALYYWKPNNLFHQDGR